MVLVGGTKPRGRADDPDKVLHSGGWVLFAAGAGFLVAIGLLFAIGGAFAPVAEGEERSWMPVVLGVELVAFGAVLVVVLWGPRPGRAAPPASLAPGGGVALPRRRSQQVAAVLGFAVVASFGVLVAVASDGAGRLALGVVIAAFALAMCVVLVRSYARGAGTIVLTPESLTLPAGTTPRTTIAWADLTEVAVTGGWQPHLVATFKGPGLATTRLLGQAWTPRALVDVLEHYRTHRDDRSQLTAPAAVDRFRH